MNNYELIDKIVDRVVDMDLDFDPLQATYILIEVNETLGLRLKELLEADDFNLIHDVLGMVRNFDFKTNKLINCFLPRFSR